MPATGLLLILLIGTGQMSEACKGKAKSKAASAATAGQENKNAASTTINMGDTALLGNYHEESVVMSVAVIFFCALAVWFIVYCVRRYGWCRKPARDQPSRNVWNTMSLRHLRHRSDEERGSEDDGAARGHKTNRCSSLDKH